MTLSRRKFLTGTGVFLAAPAIVQVRNIMPINAAVVEPYVVVCDYVYTTNTILRQYFEVDKSFTEQGFKCGGTPTKLIKTEIVARGT